MKLVFKFHNDPTVNDSEIVNFFIQVWLFAGKREGFEKRWKKRK